MRIAYVWYRHHERDTVEKVINSQRPDWGLVPIEQQDVFVYEAAVKLLSSGYDVILVHITLRYGLALELAALAHHCRSKTKVILFSRTESDATAINILFDGRIHAVEDLPVLPEMIEGLVARERVPRTGKELEKAIETIYATSGALQGLYRARFDPHKTTFTIEDHREAVEQSKKITWDKEGVALSTDAFLSYQSSDEEVARELADVLRGAGMSVFLAPVTIGPASDWAQDIRHALWVSRIVLVLLTPGAIHSDWVLIEIGAAWVLNKPIVPCLCHVSVDQLKRPLSDYQGRKVETYEQRKTLGAEVQSLLVKLRAGGHSPSPPALG